MCFTEKGILVDTSIAFWGMKAEQNYDGYPRPEKAL
jgi:hypothetical protein